MNTVAIKVEGMVCGGCVSSVTKALEAKSGVNAVSASLEDGEVAVEFDPATVQLGDLTAAIEAAGFDVIA